MDLMAQIKERFPVGGSVYRTIGKDNTDGILSCGFIRKPVRSHSDLNIVFRYYGALLLLEGEGKYIDSDGNETCLYPGCFIQRIPDCMHSTLIIPDSKWHEVFICFGRGLFCSLERIGIINSQKPVLKPGLDYILLQKFLSLYDQLRNASDHQLPISLARALEIVFLAHELDARKSQSSVHSRIEQACSLLAESNREHMSAYDVSKQIGMSYESFRKLFKEYTGISPNAYAIQRRMDIAKSLLHDMSRSIGEIAVELGYSDAFAFAKQFKKHVGQSPSDFRKQF